MKKKSKITILVIGLLVVLLAGGGLLWHFVFGGNTTEGTAYVQSVAAILGVGYTGGANSYAGIVEAKDVIEVNPATDMTVKECFVEAGQSIAEGDRLFSYDLDELTISYEQMQIDITGLQGSIQTYTDEIAQLEKQIAKAKEADQYELKLQKQTAELNKKKAEFDLTAKQQKAAEMEAMLADSVVLSPVTGTVRSVRTDSTENPFGNNDSSTAYITLVAGSDYCVKGTVNEQTVRTLTEGMDVTIRSRTDASVTCHGVIYKVNTDEPISNNNGGMVYYDSSSDNSSSKYAFYVAPDSIDGFIMGQHVYIDLSASADASDPAVRLPSYYLIQEDGTFYVYAANAKDRIEKRSVTVGEYDEAADTYVILEGLSLTDRIAYPDESVQVGMTASETQYVPDDNSNNSSNSSSNNFGGSSTMTGGSTVPYDGGDTTTDYVIGGSDEGAAFGG